MKSTSYESAGFVFWDIESLENVFTVAFFDRRTRALHVFYLVNPGTPVGDALRQAPLDHSMVLAAVLKANPAWAQLWSADETPLLRLYDLSTWTANDLLARMIGLSDSHLVNDPSQTGSYLRQYRPVCDTDPDYDPVTHPFLCGYNSMNYDTTMMAIYLGSVMAYTQSIIQRARQDHSTYGEVVAQLQEHFVPFAAVDASRMRRHNDALFTNEYKKLMPSYLRLGPVADGKGWNSSAHLIRQSMINSGRHLDVARFNEKQARVALKRLLGMLGYQILESEHLSHNTVITTMDELIELIAYNVSDVVNLANLFDHPVYSGGFDLKHSLMVDYPETVYERIGTTNRPDERPSRVRRNRLTPDSTSAKFVARVLAPYDRLKDIETVSFMYPSETRAKELGVERFDVLEAARDFFHESVTDEDARAAFNEVYEYYASIRGKNFNGSEAYREDYGGAGGELVADPEVNQVTTLSDSTGAHAPIVVPYSLATIPKRATNVPYFRQDGTPTSCFATFSTGGIHGAEANVLLFEDDNAEARQLRELIDEVVDTLGVGSLSEPERAMAVRKALRVTLSSGAVIPWKSVLMSKSSPNPAKGAFFKPVSTKSIFLTRPNGSNGLDPRYTLTSVARAVHEDFSSYYPLLLTNLSAFYNEALGEDRYGRLYQDKERFGALMKDMSLSQVERDVYSAKRGGTKLLLNSASGAGDTEYEGSPIRMNNMIISMRLIGQLFSWWIGQAQTFKGARIISTNTDGLYSADIDLETNNRVLDEQQKRIHVLIEPEELYLVSKDANNRIELSVPPARTDDDGRLLAPRSRDARILSASGSSLACWRRPSPTNSLDHPAVIDRAMAVYLRDIAITGPERISQPVPPQIARAIMEQVAKSTDTVETLLLFQNVVASSSSMLTFIYASDPVPPGEKDSSEHAARNARALQHYNRVFIVKPGTPGAVALRAAGAWKVSSASAATRERNGEPSVLRSDTVANKILLDNGWALNRLQASQTGAQVVPSDQDVTTRKVHGINPTWHMLIVNDDLMCLSPQQRADLISNLDLETYASIFAESFRSSWMNTLPDTRKEVNPNG